MAKEILYPYTHNEVYPSAASLGDKIEDMDPTQREVDPAGYLLDFTIPGLPVSVQERGSERGRAGDTSAVQKQYVSKGVLPL